ncbi:hypothetical protein RUND412_001803 [Rhizina undulata]
MSDFSLDYLQMDMTKCLVPNRQTRANSLRDTEGARDNDDFDILQDKLEPIVFGILRGHATTTTSISCKTNFIAGMGFPSATNQFLTTEELMLRAFHASLLAKFEG